jgi:hypothetical protein
LGGVSALAAKYQVNARTAGQRASREGGTRLRQDRGQAELAKLVPTVPPPPELPPTPQDELGEKVNRLESQLAKLDGMMETETDPGKLEKLTAA